MVSRSSKRKICVVITARPSYSRVKTVLKALRQHPRVQLQIVLTASALSEKYGNVSEIISRDGFPPDRVAYTLLDSDDVTAAPKSTGLAIIELSSILESLQPDLVLTIADRYETIATAISASYMNIPLAHLQGGEVSGSIDEKVRHAVTKLADLHFVSNERCAKRLLKMGESPETVHITGCPSIDILAKREAVSETEFVQKLSVGVGALPDVSKKFAVVLQHSITTSHLQSKQHIDETMAAIIDSQMPTFWFWPNVDTGSQLIAKSLREIRELHPAAKIYFLKNLEPRIFIELLTRSICLLGNSSAGIRECSFLGVPAINIGDRQAGRDKADNVIDVINDRRDIKAALDTVLSGFSPGQSSLYGDGDSGARIASLLASAELKVEKVWLDND